MVIVALWLMFHLCNKNLLSTVQREFNEEKESVVSGESAIGNYNIASEEPAMAVAVWKVLERKMSQLVAKIAF